MHTEVCIGLDNAHFPSLMYGFIMQQIYIYALYVRLTVYFHLHRMDKMAALCVALCVLLEYSPRTASNEKEIVRHEADTPTSHPGKDTGIVRKNSAN